MRQKALQAQDIQQLTAIVDAMSETIQNIRNSSLRPAADEVLHSPTNIAEIIELNQTIEEIIRKLGLILNILGGPYHMASRTGEASLAPQNMINLQSRLEMARKHLDDMGATTAAQNETRTLFEPDDRIVRLMREMNQRPGLFVQANPRAVANVMNILDEYLRSFMEATKLGVYANIQSTSSKIAELGIAAQALEEQKQEAEAFGLADYEQIRRDWIEILHMVEFTMAHLYIRLTEIYGPSAAWLLTQVEVNALKTFFRELHEREQQLKKELSGEQEPEAGLFSRMKESLASLIQTRQEPPRSPQQIARELEEAKNRKRYLRPIIQKRIESED